MQTVTLKLSPANEEPPLLTAVARADATNSYHWLGSYVLVAFPKHSQSHKNLNFFPFQN